LFLYLVSLARQLVPQSKKQTNKFGLIQCVQGVCEAPNRRKLSVLYAGRRCAHCATFRATQ
jgi:hypothetical protein